MEVAVDADVQAGARIVPEHELVVRPRVAADALLRLSPCAQPSGNQMCAADERTATSSKAARSTQADRRMAAERSTSANA